MAIRHQHRTKILDGPVSLGRNQIILGSLTVNGGSIPAGMAIDHGAGVAMWSDQKRLGPAGPYLFEYDWEPVIEESDEERTARELQRKAAAAPYDNLLAMDEATLRDWIRANGVETALVAVVRLIGSVKF